MTITPAQIEKTIQNHNPDLQVAFNGPATEAEIAEAERKLGVTFPEDFKQFYRMANGQQLNELGCGVGVPCIPRMPLGNGSGETCTWGEFLALEGVVQATLVNRELAEYDFPGSAEELIGPVAMHRNHVVFCDPGSGDCIGLDLSPAPGGQQYQVVAINHDPLGFACLADSFGEFLERLVTAIKTGAVVYVEEEECFVPKDEA